MLRIKIRQSNKSNRKNEAPLLFDITNDKDRFYISSGITIPTELWNHAKQEIRKKEGVNSLLLNRQLKEKKADIENTVEKLLKLQLPIHKRNLLLYSDQNGGSQKEKSFRAYYQEYIDERSYKWSHSTKQKYEYLIDAIEKFSEKEKYSVTFKSIDSKFFNKFEEYFLKYRNVFNNGFGGYIKNLKAFLYWAKEKGYNIYSAFEKFEVYKEDADIFPLTEEEIKIFEEAKFEGLKEDVRNVFLFQVYTGLRISDTQLISPGHLDKKNNRIHNYRAKKTGEPLFIPLVPKAIAILSRYEYIHSSNRLLPVINNQVANRYLKDMARSLGLSQEVAYSRKKGREYITFTEKRCDIISTHDARRTFITYCLTKGMSAQMIMRITGHKNYKTFERYVKLSEVDITKQLQFVWK